MKKITLLMMLAAMLTNGWAQDLITPHQDNSVSGTENDHAWVDLGLPSGLKWATCNVGAANPWDYGDYFAWGEIVGYGKSDPSNAHNKSYTGGSTVKTYYDWATYKYCSCNNYDCLTKYNYSSSYGSMVDNKKTLDLSDDAARVNMGGSWRMPTLAEQSELVDNCYWEWTNSYNGKGVKGYIVYKVKDASDKGKMNTATVGSYSLSDAHIFLPAAGCRSKSGLYDAGRGDYWSSSIRDSNGPNAAYYLDSYSGSVSWGNGSRYRGHSVRGVVYVYTITVTSNNSQYGTVSGGGLYAVNSTATLSATPYEGYKFVQWSDGNKENPRQIVVTSDMIYTADFEEDADGIADITAAGINIYTEGRTIIVENATDAITVSDALGRVVGKDDAQIVPAETRKFPVPSSGVYVVKIGNRVASVLVR